METKTIERRKENLILDLDKVLMNVRQLILRGDINQFFTWVMQWFDLFI